MKNPHILIDLDSQSFICSNCGDKQELPTIPSSIDKFTQEGDAFTNKHRDCKKIEIDRDEDVFDFLVMKCTGVWKKFERFMERESPRRLFNFGNNPYPIQEGFFIKFLETENIYIDILHTTDKCYECVVFSNVGESTGTISSRIGNRIHACCERTRDVAMIACISKAFIHLQTKKSK
jgi:hypothetical protein